MNYQLILFLAFINVGAQVESNCNRVFQQQLGNAQEIQKFEAPGRLSLKPYKFDLDEKGNLAVISNENQDNLTTIEHNDYKTLHCLYKFIANEGERVFLNFSSFKLRGSEPECSNEYVDIYLKFKSTDEDLDEMINRDSPNGRFCTSIMPRRMVSLNNMIVLNIYSDLKPAVNGKPLFTGSYEFNKLKLHDQIGPPEPKTLCTHTITGSSQKEGEFQSITYPGVYVKGLKCSYKFIGEAGQRIRLEFLDLDLYSGGSHCPLDSVKLYDGLSETTSPIIQTICGSHRSLIIYSTKEHLLVTFTTLQREAEVQNRGFSAYFEFSDKFVDPSFIQGPNVKHIRGSECDQRIISNKGSRGLITSPDPRHHLNAICRYIFEGLQTSLDYEKVLLKFTEFDLKTPRSPYANQSLPTTATTTMSPQQNLSPNPTSTTTQPPPVQNNLLLPSNFTLVQDSSQYNSNASSASNSTELCTDNYVRIYTGEQKPDQKQDPNDYDYVFCGSETPQSIESDAASLLMEYNSGSLGGLFAAEYTFIDDYRIPGIQTTSGCDYLYKTGENLPKSGFFNSPRHPSWYLNDINCSYTFLTQNDEALLLQFGTFKMFNSFNEKILGYNEACRDQDLVEIFELTLDASEQRIVEQQEIGTYCGTTTPGPILSYKPIRINFKTNKQFVHYGFSANYYFYQISALKGNEFVTNCGGQIFASQRFKQGSFLSPETYRPERYEKRNHICNWNITARAKHRISLKFDRFELEGSPLVRGCRTASVRLIGRSKIPTEICGTLANLNNENSTENQYLSENEWLSITFISTKQASGSTGFSATWSEVRKS